MDVISKYLDTTFDAEFGDKNLYKWLPWVGVSYSTSSVKTLVLGESTYNWAAKTENSNIVEERINKDDHLRIVHKNNAIDFEGRSQYARNIERAIFLKRKPTKFDAKMLWTKVAYHNLVLRAMKTKKHRPKYDDYLKGWLTFVELAKSLSIDQCVVYGLESKKIESFKEVLDIKGIKFKLTIINTLIGKTRPRVLTMILDGKEIKILFIRHPSSFFSWKKWGDTIRSELEVESLL